MATNIATGLHAGVRPLTAEEIGIVAGGAALTAVFRYGDLKVAVSADENCTTVSVETSKKASIRQACYYP